jgi:hypothetical protein
MRGRLMDFVILAPAQDATSRRAFGRPKFPTHPSAPEVSPSRVAAPAAGIAQRASNRRWSERAPTRRSGLIGGSDLAASQACSVVNLSKYGALLETGDVDVPDTFTLVFWGNRIRSEVNCIVRWRHAGRVGVCFAGSIHTSVDRRNRD